MALLSTGIMRDVIGSRPAAGPTTAGRLYFATDESKLYRDNGTTWDEVYAQSATTHAAVTLGADADTVLGLSTQQITLDTQDANKVFAGPTTGAAADPAFRVLVAADLGSGAPDNTKFLRDDLSWQNVPPSHAAVTLAASADVLLGLSTQDISLDVQNANRVFAGPTTGADAAPDFRALVTADMPAGTATETYVQDQIAAVSGGGGQGTFLISGGGVTWTTGYTYTVAAGSGYIDGLLYAWAQQDVTLDAADATYDRIDVIMVDTTDTAGAIKGLASANPSEPVVDPATQLKLALVTVGGGTTEPSGITTELLYQNNGGSGGTPAEWDWTTSGSGFNVDSSTNPRGGSGKDIEGSTVAAGAYAIGQHGAGTIDPNTFQQLVFYLRFKSAWNSGRYLLVQFQDAGVKKGNALRIAGGQFGLDASNTTDYQAVIIPVLQFAIPSGVAVNQIRFIDVGGSIGFYIDDVYLTSSGTGGSIINGLTQEQADARYSQLSHLHTSTDGTGKLAQANTHESADTDSATTSLHHTIGTGANNAAAGDHTHTGLTPADHGNEAHTSTFITASDLTGLITASDVTYDNLNSNGDVGTGATQVAQGDHTHGGEEHNAVTLAASADVLLGLTGQELSLDTKAKNTVLAGPTTGADAAPTMRALVDADLVGLRHDCKIFYVEGAVATGTGAMQIYNKSGLARTINRVWIAANTVPTGAAIIIDIHKSGTTIFTNQANRPQCAATASYGDTTTIDVTAWADGEYLTMDRDQVGSTVPGSDATVGVEYTY